MICEWMGVGFHPAMLWWKAGAKTFDHMQGTYWYGSVMRSTEFAPFHRKEEVVPPRLDGLLAQCTEIYLQMYEYCQTRTGAAK